MPQKSQYKRKPRLNRRAWDVAAEWLALSAREKLWLNVLSKPLSNQAQMGIASALAAAGLTPNEYGGPDGRKLDDSVLARNFGYAAFDVLSFLDSVVPRETTLAQRATLLQEASLEWAGLHQPNPSNSDLMWYIVVFCDLEAYWSQRRPPLDQAGIREKWERERMLVDEIDLRDQLRRANKKK